MSRAVWFVAGATTGVYGLLKARRAAQAVTPAGLRDRLAGLSLGVHLIRQEVTAEMAARENDLRARLGLGPPGRPELSAPAGAAVSRSAEDSVQGPVRGPEREGDD